VGRDVQPLVEQQRLGDIEAAIVSLETAKSASSPASNNPAAWKDLIAFSK
jgi:hypothetical protein